MLDPDSLSDDGAAAELSELEPIFHTQASRPIRGNVDTLLSASFFEVGASGRLYSRDDVVEALEQRLDDGVFEELHAQDVRCVRLADSCFLFTYRLAQAGRMTRRSSIWRRDSGRWQILYHQGTVE